MLTSPDFKELLSLLEKYNVRYLIVGGFKGNRCTFWPARHLIWLVS
jgi:hypothetical protein